MADLTQCVTLGLDQELFGVPVEIVREILDMRPICRLPHAPPYLLGITEVRGHSVPVIDLRVRLGLPAAAVTSSTRILVLEMTIGNRKVVLGLMADRVFEVAGLDAAQFDPPPEIGSRWRSDYITGIGRRGDAFVIVFDLAQLFATDELALGDPPPICSAAA